MSVGAFVAQRLATAAAVAACALTENTPLAGRLEICLWAHSLRSGLATAAAVAGKPADVILRQTGHMTAAMLRVYIKRAKLFDNNAAADIGL